MTSATPITLEDRYVGALLGLACGDAIGTTVEFSPRGSFALVCDMVGGGPFGLQPGQWTDDTSMALCLAESLLAKNEFDARHQMGLYLNWWRHGYLSSTGTCFDIGLTVREALAKFEATGNPWCGDPDPRKAGNGSLMRLAPVVLFAHATPSDLLRLAADSSRTTHGAAEAIECCQLLALVMSRALQSYSKDKLLQFGAQEWHQPSVQRIASGKFVRKPHNQIRGTGYCVESLEAALWCFFNTDSWADAVLKAVNLGDDADTTGAIVGQLAGAYYGVGAIPKQWRERVWMCGEIEDLGREIYKRFAEACADASIRSPSLREKSFPTKDKK
ncbi:MAG TPA: ADP-ribosylglycohydrolase family protein [Casimicrobium sp.]|nr:ADP-ribosylglycohydrolase family protein [Casimicrobium sp.]